MLFDSAPPLLAQVLSLLRWQLSPAGFSPQSAASTRQQRATTVAPKRSCQQAAARSRPPRARCRPPPKGPGSLGMAALRFSTVEGTCLCLRCAVTRLSRPRWKRCCSPRLRRVLPLLLRVVRALLASAVPRSENLSSPQPPEGADVLTCSTIRRNRRPSRERPNPAPQPPPPRLQPPPRPQATAAGQQSLALSRRPSPTCSTRGSGLSCPLSSAQTGALPLSIILLSNSASALRAQAEPVFAAVWGEA